MEEEDDTDGVQGTSFSVQKFKTSKMKNCKGVF
jgi:hypothetical protein